MTPILKLGDKYLFTAQIESVIWLAPDTVEIRTFSERHLFDGTLAASLRVYLNSQAQQIG
jgi:hypothetical protein